MSEGSHELEQPAVLDNTSADEEPGELEAPLDAELAQPEPALEARDDVPAPPEPSGPLPAIAAKEPEISQQRQVLSVILRKTRDATGTRYIGEALLWGVVAGLALVISALCFAALFPKLIGQGLGFMLVIGGALIVSGVILSLIIARLRRPDELELARILQQEQPSLRNDLVAAWVFSQQLIDEAIDDRQSAALAEAHVRQSVSKLTRMTEHGHLAHLLPKRELSAALTSLAGALLMLLIPALIAPKWMSDALTGSIADVTPTATPTIPERPLVGSLSLTYTFPSYTKRGAETALFTTGHVEALVGTEVSVQTYSLLSSLSQVELVIKTEAGEQARVLEQTEGGRLAGSFVVNQSGSYYFRGMTKEGTLIREPIMRDIVAVPDKAPRVQLSSPKGQLEVSPEDVIELQFSVEDDFGISSVARAWTLAGQVAGKDMLRKEINAPELQSAPKAYQGKITLDLSELKLQPKDIVTLTIESSDNNTLTGPGVGTSEALVLTVASPEDKHLKNIEEQQAVVEALLENLGDFLEAPLGDRVPQADDTYRQVIPRTLNDDLVPVRLGKFVPAHKGLGLTLTFMGQVTERLRQDPMMIPRDLAIFEALYNQLNDLFQGGEGLVGRAQEVVERSRLTVAGLQRVADYAAESEEALEKGLLRLDELLMSQKMQSVQATTKEIQALKERLKTLLEQYRDSQDPATKQAIMQEVARLRQRISELMQRMQSQMKRLPQEHVNMEALAQASMESDTKKLVDGFEDIEQRLEQNDIDGALKALEEMTKGLDSLSAQMDDSFEQPQGLSEFDKEVSALMDEVNDLASAQQKVEKETNELQKQLRQEQQEQLDKELNGATEQLKQKVQQQREALDELDVSQMAAPNRASVERMREQLNDLQKSLDQKDIEQGMRQARKFSQEIEDLRFSMQLSQRYVKRPSTRFDQLRDTLRETRPINERGESILSELEEMMDAARRKDAQSKQDPRIKSLEQQQRQIGDRAKQLKEKMDKSGGKFPALEQQVRPGLERAAEAMQDAQGGLEDRRMQRALDSERKALEELEQMKQNMKQALQNQRQQGDKGDGKENREKVEIPMTPGQNNKTYREAIQKGMKEDRLEDYSSDIESYYKSLTE